MPDRIKRRLLALLVVNPRVSHYSAVLAWIAMTTDSLTDDYRDVHWGFVAADVTASVAIFFTLLWALMHYRFTDDCPRCSHLPETALRTRRYRAWWLFGRWGAAPVLLAMLVIGAVNIWRGSAHHGRHDHIPWSVDGPFLAWFAFVLVWLKAFEFVKRHSLTHAESGIGEWLTEHAKNLLHRSYWLVLGAIGLRVATAALPKHGLWGELWMGSGLLMTGCFYLDIRHNLGLCEQCAGEFRTDASGYAATHRGRFRMFHSGTRPGLVVPLLAAAVLTPFLPGHWDAVDVILFCAYAAAMTFLGRFHNRYQPWCPICHPGDGGYDGEEAPEPTGDHGRPLPQLT